MTFTATWLHALHMGLLCMALTLHVVVLHGRSLRGCSCVCSALALHSYATLYWIYTFCDIFTFYMDYMAYKCSFVLVSLATCFYMAFTHMMLGGGSSRPSQGISWGLAAEREHPKRWFYHKKNDHDPVEERVRRRLQANGLLPNFFPSPKCGLMSFRTCWCGRGCANLRSSFPVLSTDPS